jgi:hypothetical protein
VEIGFWISIKATYDLLSKISHHCFVFIFAISTIYIHVKLVASYCVSICMGLHEYLGMVHLLKEEMRESFFNATHLYWQTLMSTYIYMFTNKDYIYVSIVRTYP